MKAFKIIFALVLALTCSTVDATQLRRVDIKKIEAQVSTDNSTSTPLGANITFPGASVDALNYGSISVAVSTDVASATDGLVISQGVDGINFPFTDSYSVAAGANKPFLVNRVAQYVKVDYTNGAAPQGSFFLSTILNPFHVPGSSHKIKDDILNDDDAPVVISVLKVQTNDENTYKNVDVQNPLPTDGDSAYAKDLYLPLSDIGTFTGDIETLFNDYRTEITDTTGTNPKEFTVWFRRPVTTLSVGLGSTTGDFSNVKLLFKDQTGAVRATVDESADSTKRPSFVYDLEDKTTFAALTYQFHTADPVKIAGSSIPKIIEVNARIQGEKPDGTLQTFQSTSSGNFKMSLEEFDDSLYTSPLPVADFLLEVKKGNIVGQSIVEKFGFATVGTTLQPVTISGVYSTPTAVTSLEIISSSATDAAAGAGAREVTLVGLGAGFTEVSQTVIPNGVGAVALGTDLLRLYRWYVSSSGTYGSVAAGSHVGTLTVRVAGAGATWSQIDLIGTFGKGQSQVGAYTIPAGKTGYVIYKNMTVDSNKAVDLFFFQRPNADDITIPYSGTMRLVQQETGVTGPMSVQPRAAFGPFPGPCDIGFLAKTGTGTADVAVDFEILLMDN